MENDKTEMVPRMRIETLDLRTGDALILRYDVRYYQHVDAQNILGALSLPDGVRASVLPMQNLELQAVRRAEEVFLGRCSFCPEPASNGQPHPHARCRAHELRGYVGIHKGQQPE